MTDNKYHLDAFTTILVNKQHPEEVFLATIFNPNGLEYAQTIFRDVVATTDHTVGFHFNGFNKPKVEYGVDAIICRKAGESVVLRSGDYFAMALGSKAGYTMTSGFVADTFEQVDSFKFHSDGIEYLIVNESGVLKATYVDGRDSYIPLHNLFTHKTASVETTNG